MSPGSRGCSHPRVPLDLAMGLHHTALRKGHWCPFLTESGTLGPQWLVDQRRVCTVMAEFDEFRQTCALATTPSHSADILVWVGFSPCLVSPGGAYL